MSRPTRILLDEAALIHNLQQVQRLAPGRKIMAMVKANAYGCGLNRVVPILDAKVDFFAVACLEEALKVQSLGAKTPAVLLQGFFKADELETLVHHGFYTVLHQEEQLRAILSKPLAKPIRVWLKVNTGMQRLGFAPAAVYQALEALIACPWVHPEIGLMSHFACADQPLHPLNQAQLDCFNQLVLPEYPYQRTMANSAAIFQCPNALFDLVRPGIMLYGISAFENRIAEDLGLKPVVSLCSEITALHRLKAGDSIGYGAIWTAASDCLIATIPVGYGDGYPRHLSGAEVAVNGFKAPVVGRISMDMLSIDVTAIPAAAIGDRVELFGKQIPIEHLAAKAGTIAYELLTQLTARVHLDG